MMMALNAEVENEDDFERQNWEAMMINWKSDNDGSERQNREYDSDGPECQNWNCDEDGFERQTESVAWWLRMS